MLILETIQMNNPLRETRMLYALGPLDGREAVLLRNRRTELTEERTVEYVI